ncbi:MAG TPA: ATP-dependent Clp protease proteolytic subunit, partial [Phycisphaerales bacterium]|nr:ATP-dependent Clp protease proteolytic subunit [Phycisphaerales bacterium]
MRFTPLLALAVTLTTAPALAQPAAKTPPTYIEIPIKGGFGEEIFASGVQRALTEAKSRKIKHAVFVIDSPGGVVADAMAIEKVMDQFESDITYHCVIVRGISASMAVVSGCRNVFMPAGGATGAAVSFSTNTNTGSAEVDAKMNAAWASQLAARADKHGQPGV